MEGDKQNASATVSASAKQSASPKNDADKDNKTSSKDKAHRLTKSVGFRIISQ